MDKQDKITIVNEKYIVIPRESIMAWLAEQGACEVEVGLNFDEGSVFIKTSRIKKKALDKWAKFRIDYELIIKE